VTGGRFRKRSIGLLVAESPVDEAPVIFCPLRKIQSTGTVPGYPRGRQGHPLFPQFGQTRFYNVFRYMPFPKFGSYLDRPVETVEPGADEGFRKSKVRKRAFLLQALEKLTDEVADGFVRGIPPFQSGAQFRYREFAPGKETPGVYAQVIQ